MVIARRILKALKKWHHNLILGPILEFQAGFFLNIYNTIDGHAQVSVHFFLIIRSVVLESIWYPTNQTD